MSAFKHPVAQPGCSASQARQQAAIISHTRLAGTRQPSWAGQGGTGDKQGAGSKCLPELVLSARHPQVQHLVLPVAAQGRVVRV
jgi:hypothetical protein